LLGNADLATEIADRGAALGLFEDCGDLLDRMTFLLHGTPPGRSGRIVPQNSH
jgi:hypothetical protein